MGERWGDKGVRSRDAERDIERDVDDEVAFHIEMRVRDNLARGMDEAEARAEALRRFGDRDRVRRDLMEADHHTERERRRSEVFGDLVRDIRSAARVILRRPGFSAVAIGTLALGIGATTAVFSLAHSLLFQPVAGVRAPEELANVRFAPEGSLASMPVSHLDYLDLSHGAPTVSGIAATHEQGAHITLPGAESRRVTTEMVSANYAEVLGLSAVAGRVIGEEDAADPYVVMISARLARQAFGGTAASVGRPLVVNGQTFTVVGVLPRGFYGPEIPGTTDAWIPVEAHQTVLPTYGDILTDRRAGSVWIEMVARVAPGVSFDVAQEQLRTATARIVEANPESSIGDWQPRVEPGIGLPRWARGRVTELFTVLAAVVAFLTVLACANAANLLLARAAGRMDELAVRRAIGAGRGRLVRQLLTEAFLLAASAGVLGMGIAYGTVQLFRGERIQSWMPPISGLEVNGTVLLFTVGMSIAVGLLFGVLPALAATRDIASMIRSASPGSGRVGPRGSLVVAQVAISLTLVVGAGLLLDTVRALQSTTLGFRPEAVLEASVDPGTQGYDDARRVQFYRDVLAGARGSADVTAAGLAAYPVQGRYRNGFTVRREGLSRDDESAFPVYGNQVSPGFIAAVGMELIEGRDFRPDEMLQKGATETVVIMSETTAKKAFPEGSALGRRIDIGYRDPRIAEVVGVVRDARLEGVKDPGGDMLLEPFGSNSWMPGFGTLYVRGGRGHAPSAGAVKAMLAAIDPNLPFYDVQPLARRVEDNLAGERVLASLTTIFAVLALALAAIGLYGVLAMAVQRRRRELGIRMVLGADPQTVRSLVVRQGMTTTLIGMGVGVLIASQVAQLISGRLWGVQPLDPFVFGSAAATLLVAALLATWVPARRATRIDPNEAIRSE